MIRICPAYHRIDLSKVPFIDMLNQVRYKVRFILEEVILKDSLQIVWEENTEEP